MKLFAVACDLLTEAMEDAGADIEKARLYLETYQKMEPWTGTPAREEGELVSQAAPYVAMLTEQEKHEVIDLVDAFIREGIGMDYMKERARLELLMLRGGRLFGY